MTFMFPTRNQRMAGVSLLGVFLAAAGCQDTRDTTGLGVGPCLHEYRSPIIEMTSAVASGNQPVDPLVIRAVTIDGLTVNPVLLLTGPTHGVAQRDGALLCTVPCGFGTQAGRYRLTIEAAGQPTRVVDVQAAYRVFKGGCPSYNDGGTEVRVEF